MGYTCLRHRLNHGESGCLKCHEEKIENEREDILKRGQCKRCGEDTKVNKDNICYRCHESLSKEDIINKPKHYHDGIQPIEAIETNFDNLETNGFLKGNVIKYILRSNKKGKELEDLKKAQWNLNKLIERLEGK